jgi:hypothetical protein
MKSLELENDSVAPDTPSHALGGLPVLHDFTRNHDTAFTAEERRRVEFEGFLRHAVRRLAVLAHVYLELRQPVDVAFAAARADLESDFAKPSRIRDLSRTNMSWLRVANPFSLRTQSAGPTGAGRHATSLCFMWCKALVGWIRRARIPDQGKQRRIREGAAH